MKKVGNSAHCSCQNQKAPGQTDCKQTITLMWPKKAGGKKATFAF